MKYRASFLAICLAGPLFTALSGTPTTAQAATAFDTQFSTLPTQEWLELPGTNLDAVGPSPVPAGSAGVSAVMSKWSGGAYDTSRDRLIVWGGGHHGYAGNEMYVFDVNTMKWIRLTEPTAPADIVEDTDPYLDGHPSARHSYDGLAYIPGLDALYARGSGLWGKGYASDRTWLFNFKNNTWSSAANHPNHKINELTDYDFVTDRVYSYGKNYLVYLDPTTNTWTQVSIAESSQPLGGNGVVDPIRRKFVRIGAGTAYIWDLQHTPSTQTNLVTTGAKEIVNANAPGLVYDPVNDRLVAWDGSDTSGSLYLLNMDTLVWTKVTPKSSVVPGYDSSKEFNGTFGRFEYMPSKNGFIAVNYTWANVYVYKLDNSAPMSVPNKPGKPTAVVVK